jgi:hypothetical protein
MITLYLEAESLAELHRKAVLALGLVNPVAFEDAPKEEPIKRPVGRPRKVQPEPVPEIDDVLSDEEPRYGDDAPEPDPLEEGFMAAAAANGAGDPVALEKLKQETVAKLPDMFAAGKVNLMRAVLTKYGKGAKSFPEIEAKDFPEIAAALARGDGS